MEKLKVYYGWARLGNVRKKRALSIMFENDKLGCRNKSLFNELYSEICDELNSNYWRNDISKEMKDRLTSPYGTIAQMIFDKKNKLL